MRGVWHSLLQRARNVEVWAYGGLVELEKNTLDFGRDGRHEGAMIGRNDSYGSLSVRVREYWMDVLDGRFHTKVDGRCHADILCR